MIVGIDIGGTHFRIGKVIDGNVSDLRKVKTIEVLKTGNTILDLKTFILEYIGNDFCEAVSIGIPGTLDKKREVVLQLPNVKALENIELVKELSKELKIPVCIERDANMQLYYDIKKYNLQELDVIVAMYFGTGIGNAIMINGLPYIGKNGCAGEIGHIPVDKVTYKCGCGNIGCMEEVAAGKYLARINNEIFKDDISKVFINHQDDPLIIEFIDRMAMAISTSLNILDPDCLLLGGAIINMDNFPKDLLLEKIKDHTRKPEPLNSLNYIFVPDEKDKGVIGAYYYALSKLK